eukprot:188117-Amphidinium_carterae.1
MVSSGGSRATISTDGYSSDTGSGSWESSQSGGGDPSKRCGSLEYEATEGPIAVSASPTPEPQRERKQQQSRSGPAKRKAYPTDGGQASGRIDPEGFKR